jgi:hypothetical protein
MRLDETINLKSLPESDRSYDPVPPGWYSARIHSAEVKTTKAGNGQYIKVRYDIVGPAHQGRAIFANLNIRNPNAKAEQIGRQQLGELMRAIGLAEIQDTDQLIGGTCEIKLEIQAAEGEYAARNEVRGWKHGGAAAAPASARPQWAQPDAPKPAAPASAAKAPPWRKG